MKEIIVATENKYFFKKLNNEKITYINLQYREAILEMLDENENINNIIIDEKTPGEISIEKLIKKILKINMKINIIFLLEKEDKNKVSKLKKLGVKKIYINNKSNIDIIINNLLIGGINNNLVNNKIISIEGTSGSGKTTITYLIIKNLIDKNKKVLLINLNKNIENSYLKLLNKRNRKKRINLNSRNNFIEKLKNNEIEINENILFINNFQELIKENTKEKLKKFFKQYNQLYDYIIIDIGNKNIKFIKNQIIKNSNKNIFIINSKNIEIKKLKEINKKNNYYLIDNKYNLLSTNKLIIKNILNKNVYYLKIFYNKRYEQITKNFYGEKNLKVNYITRKTIEAVL